MLTAFRSSPALAHLTNVNREMKKKSENLYLKLCQYYSFVSLWLYSPILGLGHLHETFRFISATRSRTVGRTPWTGDQLVARPLLTALGDCDDDGEVGGMNGLAGKPKYSEKTCPDATLSTNPICETRAQTRAAEVGSQRLTA
jgi:hypothetical protein